ncbi:DEAD/DEAH box helicase [Paenibacillus methanolicus]|uniref:Superfamily II DNA/RNA helicase n=1 Tax=Paenibacillus methanolicus TaxID=582686 RepID=A0A5S5BRJ5_9BACL|nr:DEAD/DEAH box helicase [Paenibacillus methanolicus]TYP69811.1 superfamily II DNA/RNA helicase [Paenibacillus methanolicus]
MSVIWETMGIKAELAAKLRDNGIDQPTPVQSAAIPELLAGQDVTARSQTGTGKTLAFILPALQRIEADSDALQAMVLAPTQELAMQIYRVAELYGEELSIRVQQLIGGASMQRQVEKLRQKPHLVVGTPGRIHELVQAGKLKLHQIKLLVIDEADQVFDLGSTKEVDTLLTRMDRQRQLAFFSATRPQTMEAFEGKWMREPKTIDVTTDQKLPQQMEHYYLVCDKRDKADTARRLIRMLNPRSALLFINDTDEIANYEAKFSYEGFAVETLYGDADKQRRAATLGRFRDGRCQVLIATDVAARGLDIAGLPLVVQLDPATDAEHYVHRAGRTGRMGREGTVVTIITPQQRFIMSKFAKQLGIVLQEKQMYRGRLWDADEQPTSYQSGPQREGRGREGAWRSGADTGGSRAPGGKQAAFGQHRQSAGFDRETNGTSSPDRGERRSAGERPGQANRPDAVRYSRTEEGIVRQKSGPASDAPKSTSLSSSKPAPKAVRERDRKDKGAPKWLKAKRDSK